MKYFFLLLASQAFLWACTNSDGVASKENLQSLMKENDSLIKQIQLKTHELDEITTSMNQIENNLAAIRKNENEIDSLQKMSNKTADVQEQINKLIQEIDIYVEDNRQKVAVLEQQMIHTQNQSMGLAKLVAQQKRTVTDKEQHIQNLMVTITSLKQELMATINNKNAEINSKQQIIDEKEASLNTVYYAYGGRNELMNDGIIRREGGVLGAGKSFKLASKFDVANFKKINMKEISQIDIGIVDKKNVITSHPADSYYFVKTSGRTLLKIVDIQKFWSLSKYLVIETEGGL